MTKKKSLAWLNCSEEELTLHLRSLIHGGADGKSVTFQNMIVFLEGEMGSGKSTFARVLLTELVPGFSSQGSPTFPLVQEYSARDHSPIYHIDLYRLKNSSELEDSGILHQIEEAGALALVEWPDLFPEVFSYWRDIKLSSSSVRGKKVLEVLITPSSVDSERRNYTLSSWIEF